MIDEYMGGSVVGREKGVKRREGGWMDEGWMGRKEGN